MSITDRQSYMFIHHTLFRYASRPEIRISHYCFNKTFWTFSYFFLYPNLDIKLFIMQRIFCNIEFYLPWSLNKLWGIFIRIGIDSNGLPRMSRTTAVVGTDILLIYYVCGHSSKREYFAVKVYFIDVWRIFPFILPIPNARNTSLKYILNNIYIYKIHGEDPWL